MKVKFRGKEYDVKYLRGKFPVDGEIGQMLPVITLDLSAKPKDLMEAEIHEALHACLPDVAEDAIAETAVDITKYQRRRGYRRKK